MLEQAWERKRVKNVNKYTIEKVLKIGEMLKMLKMLKAVGV